MKTLFLKIKGIGVISDSWLVNNKGDVIHSELHGAINKKMISEISQKVIQLLALQSSYIGADSEYLYLSCDDLTIYSFDLGSLVLITIGNNAVSPNRVLGEIQDIVMEFKSTTKLVGKYAKKGINKRDLITQTKMDEKSQGLLQELRRS